MPNVFSIIGESWDFFKKQPVLNHVLLWLIVLPMTAILSLGTLQEKHPAFNKEALFWEGREGILVILVLFAELALGVVLLWGTACVLVVCRKLLGNGAGRTRSSYKTVRKEAATYVANLFITGILRSCFTFLWALLLIVPGIIYAIRTFFFQIAIVCEKKEYRGALDHSKSVVIGNTWTVLWYLLGLVLTMFVPIGLITAVLTATIEDFDMQLLIPMHVITGGIWGFAMLLLTICSVILYSHIKKIPTKPTFQSVSPDA